MHEDIFKDGSARMCPLQMWAALFTSLGHFLCTLVYCWARVWGIISLAYHKQLYYISKRKDQVFMCFPESVVLVLQKSSIFTLWWIEMGWPSCFLTIRSQRSNSKLWTSLRTSDLSSRCGNLDVGVEPKIGVKPPKWMVYNGKPY